MKENKDIIDELDIDFGNIQLPELDLDIFADGPEDEKQETRYMKPHRPDTWQQHEIMYDNAQKLARDLTLDRGMRANVIVAGNFIFGDFIEAYLTSHNAKAIRMTISTLSLSQENVDSLRTLLEYGYIDQLDMIISAYFFAHERGALIPYMYEQLDIDNRFQLSVCGTHMKTVHFETLGGKKIVIHGSANLRSSANIEQFTIEENPALFDFYEEISQKIIEKYKTIKKPIRVKPLWDAITRKKFND